MIISLSELKGLYKIAFDAVETVIRILLTWLANDMDLKVSFVCLLFLGIAFELIAAKSVSKMRSGASMVVRSRRALVS